MRAFTGSAALATTALLLTALAPAANAEKKVRLDPAGDMVQIDNEGEEVTPAPKETEGDITRFVVDHRDNKVVLKASFAELDHPQATVLYFLPLKTDEGVRRNVVLQTDPDHRQGQLDLLGGSCSGMERAISYADDVLTLKVPRRCLSKPKWVKAGLGMARDAELKGGIPIGFIDDAYLDGDFGRDKPRLGPRVFRG